MGFGLWVLGFWGFAVKDLGFDIRFGVWGLGFEVQGSGSRVQGPEFRVQGSGFRIVEEDGLYTVDAHLQSFQRWRPQPGTGSPGSRTSDGDTTWSSTRKPAFGFRVRNSGLRVHGQRLGVLGLG